jgi:hypothetical protein
VNPTPIFTGRVLPGGLLVWDRPQDYNRHVRSHAGQFIEATFRKRRSKRTERASRYYFGVVVKLIAEHCGYEKDEMHELLAMKFLRIEDDPITGAPRRKRTPETSSGEFAEYVDRCRRFAAIDLQLYIPDPNEAEAA